MTKTSRSRQQIENGYHAQGRTSGLDPHLQNVFFHEAAALTNFGKIAPQYVLTENSRQQPLRFRAGGSGKTELYLFAPVLRTQPNFQP
jgi:hypothetical protein